MCVNTSDEKELFLLYMHAIFGTDAFALKVKKEHLLVKGTVECLLSKPTYSHSSIEKGRTSSQFQNDVVVGKSAHFS